MRKMEMNTNRKKGPRVASDVVILAAFILSMLVCLPCAFAQDKLSVDGDIKTNALILTPLSTPPTSSSVDGQAKIYYSQGTDAYGYFDYGASPYYTYGCTCCYPYYCTYGCWGGYVYPYIWIEAIAPELYISENSSWLPLASPKNVATVIVAAGNSLDADKADFKASNYASGQAAIQAAIDVCPAGGGVVYLMEGTYYISGAIVLRSGISLIGAGKGTALQVNNTTDFSVISASSADHILVSQLMIDGRNDTILAGIQNGISFSSVTDSKIDNVWIEDMRGSGIALSSSTDNTITGCTIGNCDGSSGGIRPGSGNIIIGNDIRDNAGGGVVSDSGESFNIISGNNLKGNAYYGNPFMGGASFNIFSGNNIHDATVVSDIVSASHNLIFGNNIESISGYGIIINQSGNMLIANNNFKNVTDGVTLAPIAGAEEDNIIFGNRFESSSGQMMIFLGLDSNYNLISSNRISTSGYGIQISAGNSYNYLAGNYVDGGGISDGGENTTYTGKQKITLERRASVLSLADASTIDPVTNPRTYIPVVSTGASVTVTIANGMTAGDSLILEGTDNVNYVTINDSGTVNLGANRVLKQYDMLELIWNGTKWVEVSYIDNTI